MNDFKRMKTIQLAVMLLLMVVIIVMLFTNKEAYHSFAVELPLGTLGFVVWLLLAVCFGFLVYDFSVYGRLKRKYGEIDMAMYSDPLTGVGNRSSIDAFIDEYQDVDLPVGVGCINFTMTHMREINERFGNKEGDRLIKEFSNILADCGKGNCFVGRNGGNHFLALFKNADEVKLKTFINSVREQVEKENENCQEQQSMMYFKFGVALYKGDGDTTMNELVALSYKKAMEKAEDDCGLWKN